MSKYYTPSIEEFRVGFECQLYIPDHTEGGWIDIIIDRDELICLLEDGDINRYRVKYLDKEDFESLCFSTAKSLVFLYNTYCIESPELIIQIHHVGDNLYIIDKLDITHNDTQKTSLFNGIIKNKSELQMLMKMLGI